MNRKGGPPKIDSMKQTVRREKERGKGSPAPRPGAEGSVVGHPSQPPLPQDPSSGAPFTEPGLARTGKRGKRPRSY